MQRFCLRFTVDCKSKGRLKCSDGLCLSGFRPPFQPLAQSRLRRRPLFAQHTVHHRIAHAAVFADLVAAQDAVFLRAQPFDGALRRRVQNIGAPAHADATQRFKRIGQQHQLTARIDVRALYGLRIPCKSDFHARNGFVDVVQAGRADHLANAVRVAEAV